MAKASGYAFPQIWRAQKGAYSVKVVAYDYESACDAFELFLKDRKHDLERHPVRLTDLKRTNSLSLLKDTVIMAIPMFEIPTYERQRHAGQ